MSLVYNNDKPIGKCESYSIDKIPGTTPFVMLTNYEPLRSELNENQQIVLEWLKEQVSIGNDLQYVLWEFTDNVYEEPAEYSVSEQTKAWLELTEQEQFQVLAAFAQWGLEQEED
ncbi:hypothetical protein [Enterococcus malodoratus]|uniref:hypothetical protein n=1 Tax=Enterococcus malodoratus TaxID=71451 RepID=UPI0022E2B3A9|nr:hypothetical protein [Enterococcus malodoratus]